MILGSLRSNGLYQLGVDEEDESEVAELHDGVVGELGGLAHHHGGPVDHDGSAALVPDVELPAGGELDDGLPAGHLGGGTLQRQVHVHSVLGRGAANTSKYYLSLLIAYNWKL